MYFASGPERAYSLLAKFSVSRAEADENASLLADSLKQGAALSVASLNAVWTTLLGNGSVCPPHRALYPSLVDCDFCIKTYGKHQGARSEAISEVAEAVALLEGSPIFVNVMPEVSVNVACAAGDASTPADVVAIPGRIVRVKNRARAMLPPEAGASIHMSRVLLLARGRRPDLRACINLRYDRKMAAALKKTGLRTLTVGRYSHSRAEDPTTEALARKLKSGSGDFDAVVDEGGSGIEPNVYVFAGGARQTAELAIKLARIYSAA